jgi:hypothetical protein
METERARRELECLIGAAALSKKKASLKPKPRPKSKTSFTVLDFIEIMNRPSESSLGTVEYNPLCNYLLTLSGPGLTLFHHRIRPKFGGTKLVDLSISERCLSVPKGEVGHFEFVVSVTHSGVGPKSVKYNIYVPEDEHYEIQVCSPSGRINLNKPLQLTFNVKVKTKAPVQSVIVMEVDGGYRQFITVKSKMPCSASDPNMLVEDTIFKGCTYKIPKPLVRLRCMFSKIEGHSVSNVFKDPGMEWEIITLLEHVRDNSYYVCEQPHTIASAIKTYLGFLPSPFQKIDPVEFQETTDGAKAFERLCDLFEDNPLDLDLLLWVIDLICHLMMFTSTNLLNKNSVAVIFSPHLYVTDSIPVIRQFADYFKFLVDYRCQTIKDLL